MIIRRWQAVAGDERGYRTHFRRRVLPELRAIRGFEGALLLVRQASGLPPQPREKRKHRLEACPTTAARRVEIEVLTFWRSMGAIRRFAGDNVELAVVEDGAKAVLQTFAKRVRHYEVVLDALRPSPPNPKSRKTH
jgi:heme-degrading monooxygenase HmoA